MKINKFLRFVFLIISIFIFVIIAFYFWASASNHSEKEYTQLILNDYPSIVDSDSIYSIVTYNIGYLSGMTNNLPVSKPKILFNNNLKKVYDEFEKINADIIGFQEIDYGSKRSYYVNQQEILQKPGYNYIFQAINWDINYLPFPGISPLTHFGEILSGQSIFSKYPILEYERIILERPKNQAFYYKSFYIDRLAQVSKIKIYDKEIIIINVHLEAYDYTTRLNQTKKIATIYNQYKNEYPTILLGDFNSDLVYKDATINIILDIQGIASANLNSQKKAKTFPSIKPTERLDYIFYNEKFVEIISSKILTELEQASDHLPVWMEFKLK